VRLGKGEERPSTDLCNKAQPSPALVMLIALNLFIEEDETQPKETIQAPEQDNIPF